MMHQHHINVRSSLHVQLHTHKTISLLAFFILCARSDQCVSVLHYGPYFISVCMYSPILCCFSYAPYVPYALSVWSFFSLLTQEHAQERQWTRFNSILLDSQSQTHLWARLKDIPHVSWPFSGTIQRFSSSTHLHGRRLRAGIMSEVAHSSRTGDERLRGTWKHARWKVSATAGGARYVPCQTGTSIAGTGREREKRGGEQVVRGLKRRFSQEQVRSTCWRWWQLVLPPQP